MEHTDKRFPVRGLALCWALVFVFCFAGLAGAARLSLDGLEDYVNKSMRTWQVPGLALAVVQDGQVVFSQGFGVRKTGEAAPVDPQTMFAIGSSTKAFTATALAMLVDQGKLTWDGPVARVLPGFSLADPWVSRHLSLRDMLSHRSGLKGADILWVWNQDYLTRGQLISSMRYESLSYPFRSQFHYNNLMYLAAGQVIPAVTGKTWDAFIKARLFAPLGMTNSNTSIRQLSGKDNVASPHLMAEGKIWPISYRSVDMIAPAGAINSNIVDMAKWVEFQLAGCSWEGEALVKPHTVLQMRSPQISMPIPYPCPTLPGAHFLGYGMGWFLQDYHGVKVVHHGGNIDGMTALVALVPEKSAGLVILSNLEATHVRDVLMYNLLDRILGREPTDWNDHFVALASKARKAEQEAMGKSLQARRMGTAPTLPLPSFAGEYRNDLYGKISITLRGGVLYLKYLGREVPLSHWHYNSFRRPNWSIEEPGVELVTFEIASDGSVNSLIDDSMASFRRVAAP
ncbi:MAG: serine hydrolase [Desulfarculaceae bacterium]|nr:serine hydrolase [Desulfarculaceae bacterium]MCF8048703.1 serine hydrolase [Desulfarculaceae bacterium]MCF8064396.1 serine hydrolase [Desulfarculaceae bacterium]MCF8098005.1 serine hydrolase [Desulfarculaceae bacterium]MCF8122234.1 serine hydrolase [Desulfarculaceae bacterium]